MSPDMMLTMAERVRSFIRKDFTPRFGQLGETFPTDPLWQRLRMLGTELWLDTGNLEEARACWTRQFAALTTNNSLLNKEIQLGRYDDLIVEANRLLRAFPGMSPAQRRLELAFILNAYHALRLVERFDAYVSVEEHTDLADDFSQSVRYARRYFSICPERFVIKLPMTPAGILATRRLSAEGIPVNLTLGFSARQNYLATRLSQPAYVNVFLGRLNSLVADNGLGDGRQVGEKATLASQSAIRQLRRSRRLPTQQIGASFRGGGQVVDLAGVDVMTMPPKVAGEFLDIATGPAALNDHTQAYYEPEFSDRQRAERLRLEVFWRIEPKLIRCLDALDREDVDSFSPEDLIYALARHDSGDILPRWDAEHAHASRREGKIPDLSRWEQGLVDRRYAVDSLMNLAGLQSFAADQQAMDQRVTDVLDRGRPGGDYRTES